MTFQGRQVTLGDDGWYYDDIGTPYRASELDTPNSGNSLTSTGNTGGGFWGSFTNNLLGVGGKYFSSKNDATAAQALSKKQIAAQQALAASNQNKSQTTTYIILGVGAVILLAVIGLVFKKK